MIWDGNGAPVSSSSCRRGCCWTQYGHSAVARNCVCHDAPADGSERPDLGSQAAQEASGVLADRYDTVTPQMGVQQNEYPRRK